MSSLLISSNNNTNLSFKDIVILVIANQEYVDLKLVEIKYFSIQKDYLVV